MSRIDRPDSNPTRTSALNAIKTRRDALPPTELPFTSAAIAWLDTFYPNFNLAVTELNRTKAEQTAQTVVVAQLRVAARMWVSHGYHGVINATFRGEYLRTALSYYGLDNNAKGAPEMGTDQSILDASNAYVNGETARIAAGGNAMPFPAQGDIMTRVTAFQNSNIVQGTLKGAYDLSQENMALLNVETDQLLLRLWNEIEAVYDKGDKPSMRRKAREWGVVYVPSPGEIPGPDEYSVKGTVTDQLTAMPLADVVMSLDGTNVLVTTDSEGHYYLPFTTAGNYTLRASKEGYMDYLQPVTIADNTLPEVNIALKREEPPMP